MSGQVDLSHACNTHMPAKPTRLHHSHTRPCAWHHPDGSVSRTGARRDSRLSPWVPAFASLDPTRHNSTWTLFSSNASETAALKDIWVACYNITATTTAPKQTAKQTTKQTPRPPSRPSMLPKLPFSQHPQQLPQLSNHPSMANKQPSSQLPPRPPVALQQTAKPPPKHLPRQVPARVPSAAQPGAQAVGS